MSGDVAHSSATSSAIEPNESRLFELALTHASVGGDNYERLEFLGDRVLGHGHRRGALRALSRTSPKAICRGATMGWSTRETCAEIGREIGVPRALRLGKQAREDGASQSDNVVGDVVEALIGALFLDGGLDAAERFILDAWEPDLVEPGAGARSTPSPRFRSSPPRRAASRPSTRSSAAPARTMRRIHRPGRCRGSARPRPKGSSKQEAETAAAAALLYSAAMSETQTSAGFVAVIGAPNAGKSTLVNALVGQKVAIVSPKAQTTRARLMGIAIHGRSANSAGRHARHLRAAAPARPGDGGGRVDRRAGRRPHPAGHRRRRRRECRGRADPRLRSASAPASAVPRAQQDRPGEEGGAARPFAPISRRGSTPTRSS